MSRSDTPAVTVRNLSRSFGDAQILTDLNLDIAPGEFIALLGRSGSGKTTLLRALGDLDNCYTGTIAAPAGRAIAFQEARLLPWKTVRQNVGIGLTNVQRATRVDIALGEVGLAHRADAWPATLSGGEGQRAALARALVREPALLLLDEPFASLDALTRIKMHRLVESLWQAHKPAVLLVTHDVDEAVLLADRVLVLEAGRIAIDERVEIARPRDTADPAFQRLRAKLLRGLGVEIPEPRTEDRTPPQLRVVERREAVA
ncbi:aliphatic sulfonates import ATP-binding protein SsuB 2 [Polymorphobacter glacialis]|uniref:Aliphatic sulfonates import ATP-binding protein SsuB 2 n=1 Tax=Sandarakinorhabdus glacialis TaxID=1614636 RepID=A0A916ZUT1_9SPHN|nr:ABC transporter ATP-binding protein [Polymorphobacter glacialis]GGE14274.1 aliphatic sulfonates import ATP-binding protein SsuB 2 [Polymorphobacter glacialis]